jgi:SSS family solute:Na+ symporter
MASVTLAMSKVLTIVLGLSNDVLFTVPLIGGCTWSSVILFLLTLFVLGYCSVSGLYGVVYTDLFQFFFAMTGTTVLAVIMYIDASGGEGMMAKLEAAPTFRPELLDMVPDLTVWNAASLSFFLYIGVVWWLSFPTGGFHVQRLLSTKNEMEATKAFLWFNIANYILRSWPWIVVGMLAIIYFPDLSNAEDSYAMSISRFLPIGLKGIMVASFLAAYMSTISTHLNWGSSYLVNDLYQAFINPEASQRRILRTSRICMVLLAILTALIATKLTMMIKAYQFLTMLWAGVGVILIARWYWWRVTAAAEFFTLLITVCLTALLHLPSTMPVLASIHEAMGLGTEVDDLAVFCIRIAVMTIVPPLFWIPYLFLTQRKPASSAVAFYEKMRISAAGWRLVETITGTPSPKGEFGQNLRAWFFTVLTLYSVMLGVGCLLFHQWKLAGGYVMSALVCGFVLSKCMRKSVFIESEQDGE